MKLTGTLALLAIALPMAIASPTLVVPSHESSQQGSVSNYGRSLVDNDGDFFKKEVQNSEKKLDHSKTNGVSTTSKSNDETHSLTNIDTSSTIAMECSKEFEKEKWDEKKKKKCEQYLKVKDKVDQTQSSKKDNMGKFHKYDTDSTTLTAQDYEKKAVKKGDKKKVKEDVKSVNKQNFKGSDKNDVTNNHEAASSQNSLVKDIDYYKKSKELEEKKKGEKKIKKADEVYVKGNDLYGVEDGWSGSGNEFDSEVDDCDE